jgi:hypothetical protein
MDGTNCLFKKVLDTNGPWAQGNLPSGPIPRATEISLIQYASIVFLLCLANIFVFDAARKYLSNSLALQEKVIGSFLKVHLFGDFMHIAIFLWAWGEDRWALSRWNAYCWTVMVVNLSLATLRLCWLFGIGRSVHDRGKAKIEATGT